MQRVGTKLGTVQSRAILQLSLESNRCRMGYGTREVWVCDMCGHAWLHGRAILPLQCAKCRSTLWNYKVERLLKENCTKMADMTPAENESIRAAFEKVHKDDAKRNRKIQ